MKPKRTLAKLILTASACSIAAGGLILWNVSGADAAVRDRLDRVLAAREARDAVRAVLTDEQRAVLETFVSESRGLRAERRAFVNEQRDILADFKLTPQQWEQLSVVADTHGQEVIDAAMSVVDARVALRKVVLDQASTEETMRNAATTVGNALADASVVFHAAVNDARAILTPDQQAMLQTVVGNVSDRRDENRYAIAERVLKLWDDLDLTGAQKEAIASVIRDALSQVPLDFRPER